MSIKKKQGESLGYVVVRVRTGEMRARRARAGLSLLAVARRLNRSETSVWGIEQGTVALRPLEANILASILGPGYEELWTEEMRATPLKWVGRSTPVSRRAPSAKSRRSKKTRSVAAKRASGMK
jgi:transcriptional regulator with XRE-family HTH domain